MPVDAPVGSGDAAAWPAPHPPLVNPVAIQEGRASVNVTSEPASEVQITLGARMSHFGDHRTSKEAAPEIRTTHA